MEAARESYQGEFSLRRARRRDAVNLAVLMDMASHGLVSHIWRNLAGRDGSPTEIGRARVRNNKGLSSHYSNWTVLIHRQEVCGAFAGYVVPDPYDPGDVAGLPPTYMPVLELEAIAKGCWFLMAIAVYAEFRRRGFGSAMMRQAEHAAQASGASRIALTVSSCNEPALRLYARGGFIEWGRRMQVPNIEASSKRREWILLAKNLKR
jgi:ribosomal protein S18 acetylase RimI-like enzyme